EGVDTKNNEVTVRTDDERAVSDDPRRLQGVTLYRETERGFAEGDRVQMTASDRERGVANRELGTIERIDTNGRMDVRWDSGRTSSFEASERRHLDYGYAVTSHSSQGQTAGRVLVHVETDRASEKLVNQRLAYVAVSRGQYDARIYTDDKVKLARALDRGCVASLSAGIQAGRIFFPSGRRLRTTGQERRSDDGDPSLTECVAPTGDSAEALGRFKGPLRRSTKLFVAPLIRPVALPRYGIYRSDASFERS